MREARRTCTHLNTPEIAQHSIRRAIEGVAEAAAARDIIHEQAALRERDALGHPFRMERLAPFARAHRRRIGIFSLSDFIDHAEARFGHDAHRADAGRVAAEQTEAALGDPTVRFVIDRAVLRAIDEIYSITP